MRRTLAILVCSSLITACGAQMQGTQPPLYRASQSSARPLDGGTELPGDSGTALPGDSGTALPGAQMACAPDIAAGTASCGVAININIAPIESPNTPASMIPGLHPSDLESLYALPVQAAGERIALVDAYDDPSAEADMSVYRAAYGLPACTSASGCFTRVNQSGTQGAYPSANSAWSEEISLDLDMVSAICPNCPILLVEANSPSIEDLGAAADTAAASGARVVSNSYYSAEWNGETSEDAHYDHAGVLMTASSGDQNYPSYPAASPDVIAVGGTSLQNGVEVPWTYSGHGCSAYEPRVRWQDGLTGCTTRSAVDVAAVADPQTGVSIYDSLAGGWLVAGGTSVGAPIVAAAYALADNGKQAPYTYAHAASLHRIDGAAYGTYTGLGSPDGLAAF